MSNNISSSLFIHAGYAPEEPDSLGSPVEARPPDDPELSDTTPLIDSWRSFGAEHPESVPPSALPGEPDIDGDVRSSNVVPHIRILGDENFRESLEGALRQLMQAPSGQRLFEALGKAQTVKGNTLTIMETKTRLVISRRQHSILVNRSVIRA